MPWIAITESDLLTVLSEPELTGYREAARSDGQPDPVAPTISQVVDLVRGYVGACEHNQLGPAGTIPQKLIAPAVDIIAVRIPLRVGRSPKKGRETAHESAIKLLEQVAACKFDIEEPVNLGPEQPVIGPTKPTFAGRKRRDARKESDGW